MRFLIILLTGSCIAASPYQSTRPCEKPNKNMVQLAAYNPNKAHPIFMAHRMAPPTFGYAENSIAALVRCVHQYPCAIVELDVRMTADSVMVLLHDDSLDRTTTGTGKINQIPYNQIKSLWLKDSHGTVLPQRIPTFDTILAIASQMEAMLAIDMKPGTIPLQMMECVVNRKMQDKVFVICYTIAEAQLLHYHYPDLLLAVGFNDAIQIEHVKKSGIAMNRLLALTPRTLQPFDYYKGIHQMGIATSFSAFGGVDTLAQDAFAKAYQQIMQRAGDIICTDSLDRMMRMYPR